MLVGISLTSCSLVIVLGMLSCTPWYFDNYLGGMLVGYISSGILCVGVVG